ncbi:Copia protein [Senna tora]|uniref:Copia protein n=1 Tax=Senna tora TaxID=362788 RepID=A0A834WTZ2_9FABA|nr:Copia protein [Senna tora]
MSGSAASSSSASSPSSDAKTYSLFSSSVQTASVKLDRSNYMLWEATVRPLIIGNRLFSHVDGVSTAPPVHLTVDGFLNRRAPAPSNECIIPFVVDSSGENRSSSSVSQALLPDGPTAISDVSLSRDPTAPLGCRVSPTIAQSDDSPSISDSRATHATDHSILGQDSTPSQSSTRGPVNNTVDDGPVSSSDNTESHSTQHQHTMVTRSRAGIFKPKIPYVGLVDAGVDSGSDSKSLAEFTKRLNSVFALKDLGPLYYFLGIEIHRDQSGFYLNQSKYAQDVLKRFNMANCASVTTPMVTGRKFTAQDGDKMSDPSLFRRAIGSLQYLITTRPDLAFSVNKLSQFLFEPTEEHFQGVKRILRYVKGTHQLNFEGKKLNIAKKGESFSVSRIWLWSKKDKLPTFSATHMGKNYCHCNYAMDE